MASNDNVQIREREEDTSENNPNANDNIGENAGDSAIEKGNEPNVQDKPDGPRVKTVTPDNDSGDPGPSTEQPASNKGQGPKGENL